jgi:hypothetical protein
MVTFPTMGQFTFMAKDQGEIGKAHRPSYLWVTYPTHRVTYGLHNYLRVLIHNLPIYPKAIYRLLTYLSMGRLGAT